MKKIIVFIIFNVSLSIPARGQVIFHENFEVPDSVISNGGWQQNFRIHNSGISCDSASIIPFGTAKLTTIAFSTVGYNSIFLSFSHIAKNEFFDACRIEVSVDSGLSWNQLCVQYVSAGYFINYGCNFNESSYTTWMPGVQALPDNSWWKHEVFNLTGTLFNAPNAMIRFVYEDSNGNGMGFAGKGWYLDDLLVTDNPGYGFVTGNLFFDANSNAIQDVNESGIPYYPVVDSVAGQTVITGSDGFYVHTYFDTVNTNYNVQGPLLTNFNKVPSAYQGSITYSNQIDSLRDFAYQPLQIFSDIGVSLIATTPVRSGLGMLYSIQYYNSGTTVANPNVVLYPDPALTYINSVVTPSFMSADSIVWILPTLQPFQSYTIPLNMLVAPGLPLGTLVSSIARIDPFAGDADTMNNFSICNSIINGSFDPNDITVSRDTIFTSELSSDPYLDYLIRFQNTGTDTAFHVQVMNHLTEELDMNSFRLLATSHPASVSYHSGIRELLFDFSTILLPDSNVNEPESHGYIWYRIEPHTSLSAGDSIRNSADIYFDFNSAVTTNTAITSIVLPTGISPEYTVDDRQLKIYPNPTSGTTTLALNGRRHEKILVTVVDLTGRTVAVLFDGTVTSDRFQITSELGALPSGLYILNLRSESENSQIRLVKY